MIACSLVVASRDYTPMSDVALFEIRAYDVFSRRPPLLGLYSTAATFAEPVYHPGPLLFYLLAIPVRLGAHGAGLAIGMGLVNAAIVVAIPWAASRFLGRSGAAIVAAVTGVWLWTFGPELLVDTFPAHAAATSFLLLLVCAWGWAAGQDRLAVPAVIAFALAGQTHGSTFVVGAGVLLSAGVMRAITRRHQPVHRRPLLVAGGVGVVLWIGPIIQQLFGAGQGNVSAMLSVSTDGDATRLGVPRTFAAMASVLVAPPWWTRPGVDDQLPNATGNPASDVGVWPVTPSIIGMLALVAAIALGTWWMMRRGDASALPGALVVAATLLFGFVYMARLPLYDLFGFMGHTARWLWPFGAFMWMFTLTGVQRHLPSPTVSARLVVTTAVLGLAAIIATPWSHSAAIGPMNILRGQYDEARTIRESLAVLDGQGPVYVQIDRQMFPLWTDSILAELARRGTPFVVNEPYRYVQLGEHRRFSGEANIRLRVVTDPSEELDDDDLVIASVPGIPRPPDISEARWRDDEMVWAAYAVRVVIEPYVAVGG